MATKVKVNVANELGDVKFCLGVVTVDELFERLSVWGSWEKDEVERLKVGEQTAFERGTEVWYEVEAVA
jgi:hypothetical protein